MQFIANTAAEANDLKSCARSGAQDVVRPPATRPSKSSHAPRSSGRFQVVGSANNAKQFEDSNEDTESVRSTISTEVDYTSVTDGEVLIESGGSTSPGSSDTEDLASGEESFEEANDKTRAVEDQASLSSEPQQQQQYTKSENLPVDIEETTPHFDIVVAVAAVLEYLVCPAEYNTLSVTKVFHSAQVPEVTIMEYLQRIIKYFKCSDSCILLGLIYVDRFLSMNPDFVVTSLTIHRLIFTSIVVATKFHDDSYYSNTFYSKVGGIRAKELNSQEAVLVTLLQWKLKVDEEEFEQYRFSLSKAVHYDD